MTPPPTVPTAPALWIDGLLSILSAVGLLLILLMTTQRRDFKARLAERCRHLAHLPWEPHDAITLLLTFIGLQCLLALPVTLTYKPSLQTNAWAAALVTLGMVAMPSILLGGIMMRMLARRGLSLRSAFTAASPIFQRHPLRVGLLLMLAALPIVALSDAAFRWLLTTMGYTIDLQDVVTLLQSERLPLAARITLGMTAMTLVPIIEELLFRGVLLAAALKRTRPGPAILYVSLLFAALHLHLPSLPALFLISCAFSIGYVATGSILTPIAMHILFNSLNLLALF